MAEEDAREKAGENGKENPSEKTDEDASEDAKRVRSNAGTGAPTCETHTRKTLTHGTRTCGTWTHGSGEAEILDLFHPVVREWWLSKFGSGDVLFTPPQRLAAPLIREGKNVLICSPTGSGKTLSAFITIIDQLVESAIRGELQDEVYCLYISPLKSLANDILRNLERPLDEIMQIADRWAQSERRAGPEEEKMKEATGSPVSSMSTLSSVASVASNAPEAADAVEASRKRSGESGGERDRKRGRKRSEVGREEKNGCAGVQRIRHAIRHGDISASERARMKRHIPHILNTTPESLAILLSSPRFRERLASVRWVIVDEIHSLASSKRGAHLSLSLERLEELKLEVQKKHSQEEVDSRSELPGMSTGSDAPVTGPVGEIDPARGGFVRIGCSATVEPLDAVAGFLAGSRRPVEIVDCRFSRRFDMQLVSPVSGAIQTKPGAAFESSFESSSERLYGMLHSMISEHRSTLIFANSRNGAERILSNLRDRYPEHYNSENSACHHGSMGTEGRLETEMRLKQGSLKFVSTSTSLELGIDMPSIDLVVQIGSPKSVSALLQRFGRGGHSLDRIVSGRIIVQEPEEMIECAAMISLAEAGRVERLHIPENALDALAQHLVGMTLERDWSLDEALALARGSYCYRNLSHEEMASTLQYLASLHPGMAERRIYPKIGFDPIAGRISRHPGFSRMIYYTNLGMIADQFTCEVLTKEGRWIGRIDESYLERLKPGDVFSVGGRGYSFSFRRGGKVYVEPAPGKPAIPSWSSERLPLSFDLARAALSFRADVLWMIEEVREEREGREGRKSPEDQKSLEDQAGQVRQVGRGREGGAWSKASQSEESRKEECRDEEISEEAILDERAGVEARSLCDWLKEHYRMDDNCAGMIKRHFEMQIAHLGKDSVPTNRRLVVQECPDPDSGGRSYYVISGWGLRVNEAISRMAGYLLSRQRRGEVFIAASDQGFVLTMPEASRAGIRSVLNSIREENCEGLLYRALQKTSLLKSVFRINATRSFLVLKSYQGRKRSARQQQFDSDMLMGFAEAADDFAVLRESYREIIEDRFEIERLREVLRSINQGEIEIVEMRDELVCPMAFGLAVLGVEGAENRRERIVQMQSALVGRKKKRQS